jgi:UDP-GlcNAc:undecaprenyl-phosphate GlcNAc-1-phosphate transferase
MVPLFVLAIPIFDICLVVVTRIMEGRSPGEAGKDHTTHRLMSIGFSQRWTLLIVYSASAVYGGIGYFISVAEPGTAFVVGVGGLASLGALFLLMMWIRRRFQLRTVK